MALTCAFLLILAFSPSCIDYFLTLLLFFFFSGYPCLGSAALVALVCDGILGSFSRLGSGAVNGLREHVG